MPIRYELLGCSLHGHELLGVDARRLRPEDAIFARLDPGGFRWHRCLRCDAWVPRPEPEHPTADTPPERDQVELPLRGRPLRDRYVLRLIALDRAVHVLVLGALAVAVFVFAAHQRSLHHEYTRVLADLQGGLGGPVLGTRSSVVADLNRLFALSTTKLYLTGVALLAYAVLLAVEMVGLWRARRWAEYLALIEATLLVPYEIYELTKAVSPLKILTLIINLAIIGYLLFRHRLFGVRGGGATERAEHERDSGWPAIERSTPPFLVSSPSLDGATGTAAAASPRKP